MPEHHPDICVGGQTQGCDRIEAPAPPRRRRRKPRSSTLQLCRRRRAGERSPVASRDRHRRSLAERRRYIEHLPAALDANLGPKTIVAGDFNHQHPATSGPALELEDTLKSRGLSIHTAGTHLQLGDERGLIDHIASTSDLRVVGPAIVWPRHDPNYRNGTKEVTDHAGSAVDFVI